MKKVHLLKYPWVRGVVMLDLGSKFVVRFESGLSKCLSRDMFGEGHPFEGLADDGMVSPPFWWEAFRKAATNEVKDQVVDFEVGEV